MKSTKYLTFGVTALAIATSTIWYTPSSEAAIPESQAAQQSVINYIQAVEKQDANEIVKWVKDTRFDSLEQQKKEYKEMFRNDPFEKVKVTNIKEVDDNNMIVSIKMFRKGSGKPQVLDLPVVKEDGKWKLLITGVETKE